jgi:hypothetical protein
MIGTKVNNTEKYNGHYNIQRKKSFQSTRLFSYFSILLKLFLCTFLAYLHGMILEIIVKVSN